MLQVNTHKIPIKTDILSGNRIIEDHIVQNTKSLSLDNL